MPKISIIIPVYNVEKYLNKCLDSVLSQSFKDFEAICIDDGSKDESMLILEYYKNKDKRIKIISQQNSGPSKARNSGLEQANGEYITFVDADDIIHPNYLKILLDNSNKKTISKCSFVDFSSTPKFSKVSSFKTKTHKASDYFSSTKDINLTSWGKLIHHSLIKESRFNENCHFSEDILFFSEIFNDDLIIKELDISLYGYFNNPKSLIHQKPSKKKIMSLLLVIEILSLKFTNNEQIYKHRISKALSNALKTINNLETSKEEPYKTITKLYQKKMISYKSLSFRKKFQLFKIINLGQ